MIKVRFAPSPTGHLHIGNLRTAILNYLFARKEGGAFILRIEDTDIERSDYCYEASIIDDLKWIGIDWDEGPIRQSDRLEIYRGYAEALLKKGFAYRCFCTKEELEAGRQDALKDGRPPVYSGRCRSIPEDAAAKLESQGRPYVIRFKSLRRPVVIKDLIHGQIRFPEHHVDDFIILRQDKRPSYNFAVVVDDMLMSITHVIRGADHIPNTPKQVMLFQVLGGTIPEYAHHPLLTGPDGRPLSKREGPATIKDFREMGILPSALFNYTAMIGRGLKEEIMDKEMLIDTFSLSSLSASDAVFDMDKLLWFNRWHIKRAPIEHILTESGLSIDQKGQVALLRENATTLVALKELMKIFNQPAITDEGMRYLLKTDGATAIALEFRRMMIEDNRKDLETIIDTLSKRLDIKKRRELFMPLRVISTGRTDGPPLSEIFQSIPKEIIIKRIDEYLNITGTPFMAG